jgi:hypothetical protein
MLISLGQIFCYLTNNVACLGPSLAMWMLRPELHSYLTLPPFGIIVSADARGDAPAILYAADAESPTVAVLINSLLRI